MSLVSSLITKIAKTLLIGLLQSIRVPDFSAYKATNHKVKKCDRVTEDDGEQKLRFRIWMDTPNPGELECPGITVARNKENWEVIDYIELEHPDIGGITIMCTSPELCPPME